MTSDRQPARYSFILPHPTAPRLLLLPGADGWALPWVEHSGGWFPEDVAALAALLRARLGVEVTVLRQLAEGEHFLGELESHSPAWTPPAGARWADRAGLDGLTLAFPEQRAALERWFAEAEGGPLPPLRAAWERRGWLAEASAWISEQAARVCRPLTGPVTQHKAAWQGSCILRAPAGGDTVWFKAVYQRPPAEPAVIELLAERWPASVPRLLAVDHDRRWMLMADFGGAPLTRDNLALWPEAMRRFSQIQLATVGELARWRALGCADRTPPRLPEELRALLADHAALLASDRGLAADDIPRLEGLLPRVEALCAALDGYGIPPAMVQQDFRSANLVATGDSFCYFDWSDTVVAHPFMSGNRFLDYLPAPKGVDASDWRLDHLRDTFRRDLRDAYLEPWAGYAPIERLRETFGLARRLNRLYQAWRWYAELAYLEPGTPWPRLLAPYPSIFLKQMLDDLTGDEHEVRAEGDGAPHDEPGDVRGLRPEG
jgi:hypothetical protein